MQGKIAVANVLSDIYAMGVTHIDNVLMILGVSKMMKEIEKEITTREMIKGFNDACTLAKTSVTGGQTVVNPWPMIGGTAISTVKDKDIIYPGGARPGDLLVLTKPLGTQVVVNCIEWLRKSNEKYELLKELKISDSEIWDMNSTASESMSRLNRKAAELMIKYKAHGSTDITGFGFKGHLENLVEAQKNCVEFFIDAIPVIKNTDKINAEVQNFKLLTGYSPETSGGLLIALGEKEAHQFVKEMEDNDESAWIVGSVKESESRKVTICNMIEIINV